MPRVDAIVDNRIRIPLVDIDRDLARELKLAFEHDNPEFHMKTAIGAPVWKVPRTLITWREEGGDLALPRGGAKQVRAAFAEAGYELRLLDRRTTGKRIKRFPKYIGDPMRPYQADAIAAMLKYQQGLVHCPTGAGKTQFALAAIAEAKVPALVILPTSGLFDQWTERVRGSKDVRASLDVGPGDLGFIRGSKRTLAPITIAMQHSLYKKVTPELADYFGMVISDESQLLGAKTYMDVINRFKAKYRIGISADSSRKDRKEFLTYDAMGGVIYEVDRNVLEKAGHVLDVEIRVVPTDFRADWYGITTEEEPEKEVDFKRLVDEMVADEARNALALKLMHEEVESGEQVIMLSARREHVRALDRYFVSHEIATGFFLGKETKADELEFQRTASGIRDGRVRVGIGTYGALGFGIDLPAVSRACAMTPIAGNDQAFNQVRGRVCRPNPKAGKTTARLYLIWDKRVYPRHLDKILAHNRSVVVKHEGRWVDGRDYRARHQPKR